MADLWFEKLQSARVLDCCGKDGIVVVDGLWRQGKELNTGLWRQSKDWVGASPWRQTGGQWNCAVEVREHEAMGNTGVLLEVHQG